MNGRSESGWAWRDSDFVWVGIVGLLGLIAITAAWFGASGTASPTAQAVWLNVAVGGFVVASAGFGLWLMRGRAAVGARRVSLVALERPAPEPASPRLVHASPRPAPRGATAPIHAVRVPGTRRVHDPECPLVAGKEIEPVAPGSGEPCGVCTR